VARLLAPHIDGFVLDTADADLEPAIAAFGFATLVTDTVMGDEGVRARVARSVIEFGGSLPSSR
jgi:hypothetical protein